MNQFLAMFAVTILAALGSSAIAWYARKIHQDFAGFAATVEHNEQRSKTNRETLVQLVRNRESDISLNPDRLAEDLDPEHE